MYTPEDIPEGRDHIATPAALLTALVTIGLLPRSPLREKLLGAYGGLTEFDHSFMNLTPRRVRANQELRPADIQLLSLAERVAFLKGAERLLGPRLGKTEAKHCICDMRAGVTLPIAAFASLLREDLKSARKAWGAFSKIRRWCAERLPGIDGRRGLEQLSFEQFIHAMAGPRLLLDLEESLESKAARAATKMLAAYEIADHGVE